MTHHVVSFVKRCQLYQLWFLLIKRLLLFNGGSFSYLNGLSFLHLVIFKPVDHKVLFFLHVLSIQALISLLKYVLHTSPNFASYSRENLCLILYSLLSNIPWLNVWIFAYHNIFLLNFSLFKEQFISWGLIGRQRWLISLELSWLLLLSLWVLRWKGLVICKIMPQVFVLGVNAWRWVSNLILRWVLVRLSHR